MFTGIIEAVGVIEKIETENQNTHFFVSAPFTSELKIDQSVAHNGVCLTVVDFVENTYKVTAINETLLKTNLGKLSHGSIVNLERCMVFNGRIDGHIVQGHVDQTGVVEKIEEQGGSWKIYFSYNQQGNFTVSKGSICINGVSLTVVDSVPGKFSVAIIPYTFEHTNFKTLKPGHLVNLEFDILGKYVTTYLASAQALNQN